ncbi:hypothetical protein ACMSW1_002502 [Cronobacter dublinensis]
MSEISKERLEEKRAAALLLTEYKHEDVRLAAQENVQVIDELLALRKERERAMPVVVDALEQFAEFMAYESIKSGDYPDGWQCKASNAAYDYAQACRATAQPVAVPDEMLCDFYEVSNWPDLVRELVKHVEQLQEAAKRNVKPWEDTFPETPLPAYIDKVKQDDEACRAAMLAAPGHDYKAIVERIAEILHGKVTDLDLLTVTAQSMKDQCKALRKEREAAVPVAESGHVRREVHVGGNTWVQCSAQAYERAKAEGKITRELFERPGQPVAVPVVPDGLRIALSNAGIAAPESDEMLWASQQDYIQMLVTWVKDRKPFKPAAVPDGEQLRALFDAWFESDCSFDRSPDATEEDNIAWRESYWYVWQRCRAAMLAAPGKEG